MKQTKPELFNWMKEEERYEPRADRNRFFMQTAKTIMGILARIRMQNKEKRRGPALSAGARILLLLVLLILTAFSKNAGFALAMIMAELMMLACCPAKDVKRILTAVFGILLFTILITLPAYFMGSEKTIVVLPVKVCCSVLGVELMNLGLKWNELTWTMHRLHVPDLFLLVWEMTMKFLLLLGRMNEQLLLALKVRSIGVNRQKAQAIGGILGVSYLKSQLWAKETYEAMNCRGFDGTYQTIKVNKWNPWDVLVIPGLVGMAALYIIQK